MKTHKPYLLVILLLALAMLACSVSAGQPALAPPVDNQNDDDVISADPTATPLPAPAVDGEQPVQLRGDIELTSDIFVTYVVEYYVLLEDLTGYITRDYEYEQPLEAQIIGPVTVDEGEYRYVLNLPLRPINGLNDVDNDGQSDLGVQVWQVTLTGNLIGDTFLGEDETGGWSSVYTSAIINSEREDEIIGGKLLIWAPDDAQQFPSGFGADGQLFSDDDPLMDVPAGYSVVDLDSEPFTLSRNAEQDLTLYEGDIQVKDFSEMGWLEAFDEMFSRASREYPFTEQKNINWDALYAEIQPRIARAEERNDLPAYYRALRDFTLAIPDGHVGLQGEDFGLFVENVRGGYGLSVTRLSDGSSVVYQVFPNTPAAEAGIEVGAEIVRWNGQPIDQAVAEVVSLEGPFSSPEITLLQQYRYLVRVPVGTDAEIVYRNPGDSSDTTVVLTSIFEVDSYFETSFYRNIDFDALPIEYRILPNGYGYVRITSLFDDLSLIIRVWERAIQVFIDNDVPAVVIDLRENTGGSPLGDFFASYFTDETFETGNTYYYSDESGEFETYGPNGKVEPNPDGILYTGDLLVLVAPGCASACEDVAYTLDLLPQATIVGHYNTHGMFGEVGRGQYTLPGGYDLQIPTGQPRDLDGNIIIEGAGVQPNERVPVTLEALTYDGDYLLDYVVENFP